MTIKQGDKLPAGSFKVMTAEGPKDVSTDELFKGKKVVLFSVPGAFTPTCCARGAGSARRSRQPRSR